MTQPDRFARVAERLYLHVGSEGKIPYPHVEKLLRAEHRAVMRLVRGERWCVSRNDYQQGYNDALNNILAALARRAK